jgi:predicted nucleic acid-binding protein
VRYVDTSAMARLVVEQDGSHAMRCYADTHGPELVTAALTRTELRLFARRVGGGAPRQADAVLDLVAVVLPDLALHDRAASLAGPPARSSHALHLATALEVAAEVFVSYDVDLIAAAADHGLDVLSPV